MAYVVFRVNKLDIFFYLAGFFSPIIAQFIHVERAYLLDATINRIDTIFWGVHYSVHLQGLAPLVGCQGRLFYAMPQSPRSRKKVHCKSPCLSSMLNAAAVRQFLVG